MSSQYQFRDCSADHLSHWRGALIPGTRSYLSVIAPASTGGDRLWSDRTGNLQPTATTPSTSRPLQERAGFSVDSRGQGFLLAEEGGVVQGKYAKYESSRHPERIIPATISTMLNDPGMSFDHVI